MHYTWLQNCITVCIFLSNPKLCRASTDFIMYIFNTQLTMAYEWNLCFRDDMICYWFWFMCFYYALRQKSVIHLTLSVMGYIPYSDGYILFFLQIAAWNWKLMVRSSWRNFSFVLKVSENTASKLLWVVFQFKIKSVLNRRHRMEFIS